MITVISGKSVKLKALMILVFLVALSSPMAAESPYKDAEINRMESSILKEFNKFEFLESVVSASDGSVYVTNIFDGVVYRIKDDRASKLIDVEGTLVGLTLLQSDKLLVTGSDSRNRGIVRQVNMQTGSIEKETLFPEAMLLNGVLVLDENTALIADSLKGVIWKLNLNDGSSSIWLDHELLDSPAPQDGVPGVNGIKKLDEAVYLSNTGKMLMVKIPLKRNGSAGSPEIVKDNVFIDDLALDSKGNIYRATHAFDSVIKITVNGDVSIIAQADQGVSGSTSVNWLYGSEDTLLISAHGGITKEDKSEVVSAKIIQIKLK